MSRIAFLKNHFRTNGIDEYTWLLLRPTVGGIPDVSLNNRSVTLNGSVTDSAAQYAPIASEERSAYFDGTGDYIAIGSPPVGADAFCYDMWFRLNNYTSVRYLMCEGASTNELGIRFATTGKLGIIYAGAQVAEAASAISVNTWHHVAFVGDGAADGSRMLKVYIDGVLVCSAQANYNVTNKVYIGSPITSTTTTFIGYMGEMRVSVGHPRFLADFTVPSVEYRNVPIAYP